MAVLGTRRPPTSDADRSQLPRSSAFEMRRSRVRLLPPAPVIQKAPRSSAISNRTAPCHRVPELPRPDGRAVAWRATARSNRSRSTRARLATCSGSTSSESVRLTPKSVLGLFQFIGKSGGARRTIARQLHMPALRAAARGDSRSAAHDAVHVLALRQGRRPAHHVQSVPAAEELHPHADARGAREAPFDRAPDRVLAVRGAGRPVNRQRLHALRLADRIDRSRRRHEGAAGARCRIRRSRRRCHPRRCARRSAMRRSTRSSSCTGCPGRTPTAIW